MSPYCIRIGEASFPLAPVLVYAVPQEESGKPFLLLDLHAAADKTAAGFAINCLTLRGRTAVAEIAGLALNISKGDANIELGESVICKPGWQLFDLEIAALTLTFGALRDGRIDVNMQGRCFNPTTAETAFSAHFGAAIK